MPVVEELSNPALKQRHWEDIFRIVGMETPQKEDGAGYEPFSVADLMGNNVLGRLEEIQVVNASASKEYSLEKALEKMKLDWEGVEFRVVEYKDTGTYIVGGTDEIQVINF